MPLTVEQKEIAKLKDSGDIFLYKRIKKLEQKIPTVIEAIQKLSDLKGEKGDTPSEDEVIALINSLMPEVEDGKDYVITEQDKKDIAGSIKVPVVEKVIEKTEVIKEKPIVTEKVTNKIKEVAVTESAESIVDKIESISVEKDKLSYNSLKDRPNIDAIIGEARRVGTRTGGGGTLEVLEDGVKVGSSHRVNFGTGLDVSFDKGTISVVADSGESVSSYVQKTANYTLTTSDETVEAITNPDTTFTLPTAVGITGKRFDVANSTGGSITIDTNASQTIYMPGGVVTSVVLADGEALTIKSNGANYRSI